MSAAAARPRWYTRHSVVVDVRSPEGARYISWPLTPALRSAAQADRMGRDLAADHPHAYRMICRTLGQTPVNVVQPIPSGWREVAKNWSETI